MIKSVNVCPWHPIIVVMTVIDIVCVLAATAVVETLVVVVIVPGSDVMTLPPPVAGFTIANWMSTGGWRRGFVLALSLILASLQHQEIKRILAKVSQ